MRKPKSLSQLPEVAVRNPEVNNQGRILDHLVTSQIDITASGSDTAREECPLCLGLAVLEQDHDHLTDLCRGRICHACNVHLGRFDRPLAEIQRFLEYLSFWQQQHATVGAQTYTDWMRERFPNYRRRGRPRQRQQKGAA